MEYTALDALTLARAGCHFVAWSCELHPLGAALLFLAICAPQRIKQSQSCENNKKFIRCESADRSKSVIVPWSLTPRSSIDRVGALFYNHMLLLIFIAIPLIEIALFIGIGGEIGIGWTLMLVILTAMMGVALLKRQGFTTWQRARWRINQGQMPAAELLEGVCLVFAGALLLTPGFATDGCGFALLIPFIRQRIVHYALGRLVVRHMRQRGFEIAGEYRRDD